eukprot:gene16175-22334_t
MSNVKAFFKKWSSNGPKHRGGEACMHPASQEEIAYSPQAVRASRRGGHLASGTSEWRRFLPLTDNTSPRYRLLLAQISSLPPLAQPDLSSTFPLSLLPLCPPIAQPDLSGTGAACRLLSKRNDLSFARVCPRMPVQLSRDSRLTKAGIKGYTPEYMMTPQSAPFTSLPTNTQVVEEHNDWYSLSGLEPLPPVQSLIDQQVMAQQQATQQHMAQDQKSQQQMTFQQLTQHQSVLQQDLFYKYILVLGCPIAQDVF